MKTPSVIDLDRIRSVLPEIDLLAEMKSGFIAYSRGDCIIPPVGELIIDEAIHGEVHIKYGYARGGRHYVIKIASGFPGNEVRGISPSNGMMLLFDLETGELRTTLLDQGHLTDVRTAAAGALASLTLAPSEVSCIGILGTGVQARLQLQHASRALGCKNALVWGRNATKVDRFTASLDSDSLAVSSAASVEEVLSRSQVVITCTAACEPIIRSEHVQAGTHITAVGSDTPDKQELDADLLAKADLVVVDSIQQGRLRGEVAREIDQGAIDESGIIELGSILDDSGSGRSDDHAITVADLTGVAVQDLRIAEAVLDRVSGRG